METRGNLWKIVETCGKLVENQSGNLVTLLGGIITGIFHQSVLGDITVRVLVSLG